MDLQPADLGEQEQGNDEEEVSSDDADSSDSDETFSGLRESASHERDEPQETFDSATSPVKSTAVLPRHPLRQTLPLVNFTRDEIIATFASLKIRHNVSDNVLLEIFTILNRMVDKFCNQQPLPTTRYGVQRFVRDSKRAQYCNTVPISPKHHVINVVLYVICGIVTLKVLYGDGRCINMCMKWNQYFVQFFILMAERKTTSQRRTRRVFKTGHQKTVDTGFTIGAG